MFEFFSLTHFNSVIRREVNFDGGNDTIINIMIILKENSPVI